MINAIIIEDELQYAEMVQSLLKENYPDIFLEGCAGSIKEAEELLKSTKPDIVFCDIELPDGTAFDLLRAWDNINFQIIFITAHNQFAVEAFKFSAVDYLLKPIQEELFVKAVDKAGERLQLKQMQHIELMLENLNSRKENKRLVLRTLEQIHIVDIQDIIHLESDNTYTTFYLTNSEQILVSKGMKDYEEMLVNNGFFKIHRSHIINLKLLRKIDKSQDEVLLADKTRLPLSTRRKQMLIQILNGY